MFVLFVLHLFTYFFSLSACAVIYQHGYKTISKKQRQELLKISLIADLLNRKHLFQTYRLIRHTHDSTISVFCLGLHCINLPKTKKALNFFLANKNNVLVINSLNDQNIKYIPFYTLQERKVQNFIQQVFIQADVCK